MNKHRVILSLAVAGALAAGVRAENPTIERLAPESTIFIAGVRNAEASLERLKATPLGALWRSPQVQELCREFHEELRGEMGPMLEELDVSEEDVLTPPSGAMGFVVFAVRDEELGLPMPALMGIADYGERAGRIGELLDAVCAKAREDESVRYEERDVRGRTVRCFQDVQAEAVGNAPPDGMDEFGMMGGPEQMMADAFDTIYVVRDGSLFLASSDLAAVDRALGVRDGDEEARLTERVDFRAVMDQIGRNDAYVALLVRDLGALVNGMDPTGMMMMMGPMVQQVVGDIDGFGIGVRIAGDTAMVEERIGVYMPNGKAGLTALMQRSSPFGRLPSFVGANTISYTEANFEFSGLPMVLQPIMQMMPMMMPPMGEGPAMPELVNQFCATLGRKVYVLQTLDRPIRLSSMKQLVAIECTRPQQLAQLVETMGAQMGMEGRDFLGHRLYTIEVDMGAMMPMAGAGMGPAEPQGIGIGGGYFFAGPASAVEQALRSIGDAKQPGLVGDAEFARAVNGLGGGQAVAWGYSDVVASVDAAVQIQKQQIEAMREAFGEQALDLGPGGFGMITKIFEVFDPDLLRESMGPAAWNMLATDDGFVVNSYFYGPAEVRGASAE